MNQRNMLTVVLSDPTYHDENEILKPSHDVVVTDGEFKWHDYDRGKPFRFVLLNQFIVYSGKLLEDGVTKLSSIIKKSQKIAVNFYIHQSDGPSLGGLDDLKKRIENNIGDCKIYEFEFFSHNDARWEEDIEPFFLCLKTAPLQRGTDYDETQ